ncbi:MAG: DUF3990 domain-containing protein [Bacillota bacterium]|nr:DUF3990 domain-containing protein [Bacillota bacterium]
MEIDNKILKHVKKEKWYHGTTLEGFKSILSKGVIVDYNKGTELDFGFGFYLTPEFEQAERYIKKILEFDIKMNKELPMKDDEDSKIPVVIEFDFKPLAIIAEEKYKFKSLNQYDDEFAEFVFFNRIENAYGENQHEYDMIFGVMSDSTPIILIQQYRDNIISKEEVIHQLKKTTSFKQLSLHRQELCDIIKPTKAILIGLGKELNIDGYYIK